MGTNKTERRGSKETMNEARSALAGLEDAVEHQESAVGMKIAKVVCYQGSNVASSGGCSSSNPPDSIVALDEAMGNYSTHGKSDDDSTLVPDTAEQVEGANKENENDLEHSVKTNSQDDDLSEEAEWNESHHQRLTEQVGKPGKRKSPALVQKNQDDGETEDGAEPPSKKRKFKAKKSEKKDKTVDLT